MRKTLRNLRYGDIIYSLIGDIYVSPIRIDEIIWNEEYTIIRYGCKQIMARKEDLDVTIIHDRKGDIYLNKEDLIKFLESKVDILRWEIFKLTENHYERRKEYDNR
jgi:hypothetical protein